MTVKLNAVVVHELVKEAEQPLVVNQQRIAQRLLDASEETVIALIQKIHDVYGTKENACEFGIFLTDNREGIFPQEYDSYINKKNDNFLLLSHTFMAELINQAKVTDWATGGYIVCTDYTHNEIDYVVFAMIKKTNEIRFKSDLTPEAITAINLKKLHQAVRLNKQLYLARPDDPATDPEYTYLSFLGDSATGAAVYFVTAVGCQKGLSSKKATDSVYKFVQTKFKGHPALQNSVMDAKETLTEFFSAKIADESPVTLNDVAAVLLGAFGSKFADENEKEQFFTTLVSEMNDDSNRIPRIFNASSDAVKGHRQIKYRSPDMTLSIDAGALSHTNPASDIYWEDETEKLSIKADSKLTNEIRRKIYGT